jgi:hypothetical protein
MRECDRKKCIEYDINQNNNCKLILNVKPETCCEYEEKKEVKNGERG